MRQKYSFPSVNISIVPYWLNITHNSFWSTVSPCFSNRIQFIAGVGMSINRANTIPSKEIPVQFNQLREQHGIEWHWLLKKKKISSSLTSCMPRPLIVRSNIRSTVILFEAQQLFARYISSPNSTKSAILGIQIPLRQWGLLPGKWILTPRKVRIAA